MTDTDATTETPVYEIRVRFHGLCPEPWMTLEEKPIHIGLAHNLAVRRAIPSEGATPAEVLVVGQWGPVDRWLDGQRAALESLTPCHPGGCTCGECVLRWEHREGGPRHQPCGHGACRLCNGCYDCDTDELHDRLQELAARKLVDAGDGIEQALTHIHSARKAFQDLNRERRETELDIDSIEGGAIQTAMTKITRIIEALDDVGRIVENAMLRAQLDAALEG